MLLRNDIVVDGETEAGAFRWRYARNGLRLGLSPASTSTAALFHLLQLFNTVLERLVGDHVGLQQRG